jgi:hypothetical protein
LPVTDVTLATVNGEDGPLTVFNLNCLLGDVLATGELKEYAIELPLSTHIEYGRVEKDFVVPFTVTTVPVAVESKPV